MRRRRKIENEMEVESNWKRVSKDMRLETIQSYVVGGKSDCEPRVLFFLSLLRTG